MEKGYYTDNTGQTHLIKGAYADTGDGIAHRVLKAYVGDDNGKAKLWYQYQLLVQSVAITKPPNRTIYTVGDSFDPAGMVVEATYQTGGKAAVTGYACTPSGPLGVGDTTITITYEINGTSASAALPITVTTQSYYVIGLAVTTPPNKTGYFYGDSFDPAGVTVTATYNDGTTRDVTANCVFDPSGSLTINDTSITITYTESGFTVSTTQLITVVRKLASIAVITPPLKVEYNAGDVFTRTGMVVRAQYNNGTSAIITAYTHSPTGPLASSDTAITISYTENGITRTTIQEITVKSYDSVLDNNTWDMIAQASEEGIAATLWTIGDYKDIVLSTGEVIRMQIYGFDHDDLEHGGKAGITFGAKNLLSTTQRMAVRDQNSYGYANAGNYVYMELVGETWDSLPDDAKAVIKPVIKKTSKGNRSAEISSDTMSIFAFSEIEITGTTDRSFAGEGEQYPVFTDALSRKKYVAIDGSGNGLTWWLRSPDSASTTRYGIISGNGNLSAVGASYAYYVCFGFCV